MNGLKIILLILSLLFARFNEQLRQKHKGHAIHSTKKQRGACPEN